MVADWFVLGVVDGCLPDSADNIHGMDSRRLRRELKPMAHFKHREDIGERALPRQANGEPKWHRPSAGQRWYPNPG